MWAVKLASSAIDNDRKCMKLQEVKTMATWTAFTHCIYSIQQVDLFLSVCLIYICVQVLVFLCVRLYPHKTEGYARHLICIDNRSTVLRTLHYCTWIRAFVAFAEQWNLSIVDTTGTQLVVLYREVPLIQR